MSDVMTVENTEMQRGGESMNKYELLASVVDAKDVWEAKRILKSCQVHRGEKAFDALYYVVARYVAEWQIRSTKGGDNHE